MKDLAKELFEDYTEYRREYNGHEYSNVSFKRWLESEKQDPYVIINNLDLERNSEDELINSAFDSLKFDGNLNVIGVKIEEFKNEPIAFSFKCFDFEVIDMLKDLICLSEEDEKKVKDYLRYILKERFV